MATANRAYTSEYTFNRAPERQPERVRRTRQRPQQAPQRQKKEARQTAVMTAPVLRALIIGTVALGILLIGIVVVNAQTADLQYSINQMRNENRTIQSEIDMLNMQISSNTGIEKLETFATDQIGMRYPQEGESILIYSGVSHDDSLADMIKAKAYE